MALYQHVAYKTMEKWVKGISTNEIQRLIMALPSHKRKFEAMDFAPYQQSPGCRSNSQIIFEKQINKSVTPLRCIEPYLCFLIENLYAFTQSTTLEYPGGTIPQSVMKIKYICKWINKIQVNKLTNK